jgi:signal transduction histidine kinase
VSRRDRLSTSARVALAVTLVLLVGVTTLSAISYFSVRQRLRADVDRTLLRETEAFASAMRSAGAADPAYDLRTAARSYLETRSVDYSISHPVLLVRLASGHVLSNSAILLDRAPENAQALDPSSTRPGYLDFTYAGETYRAAATADRVTQARLAERVAYEGPDDEVGSLVSAVNAMLDRLESAFREQRRFLADASHELRTPLAIVSGHLEMLSRDALTAEERADELAIVSDEVARMGRLVDDMLSLARLEAEAARPFQALEIRTLLAEAAGRGRGLGYRKFVVDAVEDLWVYGEPDQLMQALLNLLKNAISHSPEGSTITLAASAEEGSVRIAIEDSGPGIRTDDTERVFDRFFRSHGSRPAGGGSGLGLAIVKRLVELHGGTVAVANRPTGGAVFTIRLPRIPAPR